MLWYVIIMKYESCSIKKPDSTGFLIWVNFIDSVALCQKHKHFIASVEIDST